MVWSQALITEVYALNSLLLVVFLIGLDWKAIPGGDWTRGVLLGLAACNHLANLVLLPLLALDLSSQSLLASLPALLKRLGGVVCGLTFYLLLPMRALAQSPVNWGNPLTLADFWWLVSARLYASYPFGTGLADVALRLRAVAGLLITQFSLPGVAIGIYGLFSGIPRRILLASLWLFIAYSVFATGYASYDSNIYLIPTYLAFTIWLAYGLSDLLTLAARHVPQIAPWLAVVLLLGFVARIPGIYQQVDASHDTRAQDFGARFVSQVPANSLVIANSDEAVFALWYFHYALGLRPDTVVISEDLVQYDWYINTLTGTYPALVIPASRPITFSDLIAANPARPVCYTEANIDTFCK